jgi:transposase-like protein
MKRRRHTPGQIVRKLREADRLLGEGKDIGEVLRHLEVYEATLHRWRNQYGGMKAEGAKRLRELERENGRLKRVVAEQALDIQALKEIGRGRHRLRVQGRSRIGRRLSFGADGLPLCPLGAVFQSLAGGCSPSW